jgi:hypothetical protein
MVFENLPLQCQDCGDPAYEIWCSDGSVLYPSSVDEIVAFANSPRRQVRRVLASTSYSKSPRLKVDITNRWESGPTVEHGVTGEEKEVLYISDRLDEWALSVRQSYSLLAFSSAWTYALAGGAWTFGIVIQLAANVAFHKSPPMISKSVLNWATLVGIFLLSTPFWAGRVRRWLFPAGVFATGDGAQRLHRLRTRQKWVSFGSLLAAIATIILGIIANRLSR